MGAADHEVAGRVDVVLDVVVRDVGRQDRLDHLLDDRVADRRVRDLGAVLGRDDDGVDADGHAVLVLDGHLALAVRAEPGERAVLPELGQAVDDPVRQGDRQRHQLGRLVGGVAEHQPLVAGADLLAPGRVLVDPHRDVGRLLAQRHQDAAGRAVEAHLAGGVADLADDLADDARVIDQGRRGDLPRQADQPGGQQGLAGDPGRGVLRQDGVEDAIGDLVGHLVGMAHRDGLTREQVTIVGHGSGSSSDMGAGASAPVRK